MKNIHVILIPFLLVLSHSTLGMGQSGDDTIETDWIEFSLGSPITFSYNTNISVLAGPDKLWGIVKEKGEQHKIICCHEGTWREVLLQDLLAPGYFISNGGIMPDGTICFELLSPNFRSGSLLIYENRARRLDLVTSFKPNTEPIKVIVKNEKGAVWNQNFLEQLFYGSQVVTSIPREAALAQWLPFANFESLGRTSGQFAEDPVGRIWFAPNRSSLSTTPSVVIIVSEGGDEIVKTLSDAPFGPVIAVCDLSGNLFNTEYTAPTSKTHVCFGKSGFLWLVLEGRELWKINMETLEGTLLCSEDSSLEHLTYIFEEQSFTYVINQENLYRLNAGSLEPILPGKYTVKKQIVSVNGGIWIAASPQTGGPVASLWFIPDDGSPAKPVDEQSGLTTGNWLGVTAAASGKAIAYNAGGELSILPEPEDIVTISPLRNTPEQGTVGQIPPDVEHHQPGCSWVFFKHDVITRDDGRIYGIPVDRSDVLTRWDGLAWEYLPLPEPFSDNTIEKSIYIDWAGNLWLFRMAASEGDVLAARFFPEDERWESYTDLRRPLTESAPGVLTIKGVFISGAVPFRDLEGRSIYLTEKEVHACLDGTWKTWPAREVWKVLYDNLEISGSNGQGIPDTFNKEVWTMILPDGELLLQFPEYQRIVYKDSQWSCVTQENERYMTIFPWDIINWQVQKKFGDNYRFKYITQALLETGMQDKQDITLGWLAYPPATWKMVDGRLYRTFDGEQCPVFPENICVPLPEKPEIVHARICAGRYPLLSVGQNQYLIILEELLKRPDIQVQATDGNSIHLSVPNLEENTSLYWRFYGLGDEGNGISYSLKDKEWVARQMGDQWKRLEGTETRLGPFEDGQRIIEAMVVDNFYRTSEQYRIAINISTNESSIENWAGKIADAWPQRVPEAEKALRTKGKDSLNVLQQLADSVPENKVPAIKRMIRIIDSEYYIPAPDPPLQLPELLEDSTQEQPAHITDDGIEETHITLQQDPEGWIWYKGDKTGSNLQLFLWTGNRWFGRAMPYPEAIGAIVNFDSEYRIWITGEMPEHPVWVYMPLDGQRVGEGVCKRYDNVFAAIDALWQPNLQFGTVPYNKYNAPWSLAAMTILSPEDLILLVKEAIYTRQNGKVQRWGSIEMPGPPATSTEDWQCFYDNDKRPMIQRQEDVIRFGHEGKWEIVNDRKTAVLPAWATDTLYLSCWTLKQDGLYREDYGISGLAIPREKLPPDCPPAIADVIESPCGTLFLIQVNKNSTNKISRTYYPLERPETKVDFSVSETGRVVIHVKTNDESLYHTWRLAGGAWQPAVSDREFLIHYLPLGHYTIEVSAINKAALADLSPEIFEFESREKPEQLQDMLKILVHGEMAEREDAIQWFLNKGKEALPHLNTLLPDIHDENARWQVEALIQRIEGNTRTTH